MHFLVCKCTKIMPTDKCLKIKIFGPSHLQTLFSSKILNVKVMQHKKYNFYFEHAGLLKLGTHFSRNLFVGPMRNSRGRSHINYSTDNVIHVQIHKLLDSLITKPKKNCFEIF